MYLVKNTAVTGFGVGFSKVTDGTPVTAGTPVGYVTLDGGAQATIAGAFVHEGNGQWSVNLTAGETNGDIVLLTFVLANATTVTFTIKTISTGLAASISSSLARADYKTYARITATTYDDQIDLLLAMVQAQAERYTGRLFTYATYTEYHDGADADVIMVKNPPITAVTSIKIFLTPDDTPTAMATNLYSYSTDETGIIRRQPTIDARFDDSSYSEWDGPQFGVYPRFQRGFRNVQVVYTGGYGGAGPTLPADLKMMLFKVIDIMLNQAGKDSSLNSEKLGSYEYLQGQFFTVQDLIAFYFKPFRRRGNVL